MTFLVVLLSHVAAAAIGVVVGYGLTVRNLAACEVCVEGTSHMALTPRNVREKRPAPSGIAWIALIASLFLIIVSGMVWVSLDHANDRQDDTLAQVNRNTDDIRHIVSRLDNQGHLLRRSVCGTAVLFLGIIDNPINDNQPPPSKEQQQVTKQFRDEFAREIEELRCVELTAEPKEKP